MHAAVRGIQGDLILAVALAALLPCVAGGQATPQKPIPIRRVVTLASTDSGVVAGTSGVHILGDGRVLLNDEINRRLSLFDTTLKHYEVVADTAAKGHHPFGTGRGGLVPFTGDSTAWVDADSRALIVLDAKGVFGRAMALPRPGDLGLLTSSALSAAYGVPGFDAKGRLYYRATMPVKLPSISQLGPDEPDSVATLPDSAPIVRADLEIRRVDTVAYMKTPHQKVRVVRTGPTRGFPSFLNPLPATDEWAYLPDGSIAIVRGHDYHVDWISPDGARRSSPKMPFDWRRVTDEEKQRMLDSTQRAGDSAYAAVRASIDSINADLKARGFVPRNLPFRPAVVSAADLPDYYPPIRSQQIRVDRNGNLWVIPATSAAAQGGNLFDVINRNGEIIERVQLPAGRNLSGFGPNDTIYMSVPAQAGWARLERARIVRN